MKVAAATVPVVEGSVTPPAPPVVRVPPGARIAVPAVEAETATLPKFISTVLVILIGVMMVAEADAVAVAWANEPVDAQPNTTTAITFAMFFILFSFFDCLKMFFEFVLFVCLHSI